MEKRISLRVVSFILVACMLLAFVPYSAKKSHVEAAAPASYTTITSGSSKSVSITSSGQIKYFKFVPTVSGTYKFYSSGGSIDTYGYLLNSSGSQLASDDDSGTDNHFSISYSLTAGATYYWGAKMYGSGTGSYTVYLQLVSQAVANTSLIQTEAGNKTYTLFNSGRTGSGNKYSSTTNPNPNSTTNNGYDIYASYSNLRTTTIGASFKVNASVTERATLSIYAYDVDESSGERDVIYLVDETTGTETQLSGYLSGMDSQWNTTSFYLNPSMFTKGHTYHFKLAETVSGWVVYVRNVSLQLTTEGENAPVVGPTITNHSFSASINNSGYVSTTLNLTTSQTVTYSLEYAATYNSQQYGSATSTVTATTGGVTKNVSFYLQNAPKGAYSIEVILKDSSNNVVATYVVNAGYQYSSVTYNSNGGSNNFPIDNSTYSSGNTVTVLFDYIPSRNGYTFLGWARSSTATSPEFTQNGTKTFTIGSSDVTLYAVWRENVHEHSYVNTVVNPTCEREGYTLHTCSCGESYKDSYTSKLDHDYVETVITEPSCGVSGTGVLKCNGCGDETNVFYPALTHNYTSELTKEATCTEPGIMTYTCQNCNDSYITYIYSTHNIVEQGRTEPTCTVDGKIVYGCTKCEYTYEEIIPGGHNYEAEIITVATQAREGLVRYTCAKCGDSYDEIIPIRPDANVLLVQDRLPWSENSNSTVLDRLKNNGQITGWDMTTTGSFNSVDLTQYSVIFIANDQTTATYNQLKTFNEKITAFANAGGVVIYGACDNGWAGGNISYALPGGVTKGNYYSNYNYIVNGTHNVVTGVLTDGMALTNQILYNTYCSHTYFNKNTLPENAIIILSDSKGEATLVEYPMGNGYIIASGLTWEHAYVRNLANGTSFAKNVYDDLIVHAISLSNACAHVYTEEQVVDPTCESDGYTAHICEKCGAYYKDNIIPKLEHDYVETVITEPSCGVTGTGVAVCSRCQNEIDIFYPALVHNYTTELTKEATCTEPGIMTHTCQNCGDTYVTYIYATHEIEEIDRIEPTCTVDGKIVYGCTKCEHTYEEIITADHDYVAEIVTAATPTSEGLVKYTCSKCGDHYYVTTPARPDANILLVQDRLPWTEDINRAILERLLDEGYISGWDMTTTASFNTVDLTQYSVIFIANDQTTATYNQLKTFNEKITEFAMAGGVVVYGACDNGWAGGNISYALPGGVTKGNYYSNYNYIVNGTHNVVTGVLTDGKALTNQLLYSTYSSHTYFNSLPNDAIVILSDSRGGATLVEYPLGNGYVIASGLTWEYTYVRNFINGTSFAKSVYDDLLVHAVSLGSSCEHVFDLGETVAPTCTEDGYTLHTCENCGATVKSDIVPAFGHTEGEWITEEEATNAKAGLKVKYCLTCGEEVAREIIPMLDAGVARVESQLNYVIIDDEIVFFLILEDTDPTKSLAIQPIFDADIFEIMGAEWLINADIQHIENGTYRSVSGWSTATDVNTTVYKFTLKAKALAESTEVSCTVLMDNGNISLSVLPKTVSVISCPHSDASFNEIDSEHHVRICNRCGYAEASEHSYDDECDVSCNDCGYERVAPHAYYQDKIYDENNHWLLCEKCGHIDSTEAHLYDDECDGSCNGCAYERVAPHAYYEDKAYDDNNHWLLCEKCGHIDSTEAHLYDDECDNSCNGCAYEREAPHHFTIELVYDGASHWYECTLCGEKKELDSHTYDDACDESCNDCAYERVAPHNFHMEWSKDANGHWYTCKSCGETSQVLEHIYDNDCDGSCNECAYERTAPHAYDESWRMDDTNHWHECMLCGSIAHHAEHSYDDAADRDCNDCGYVRYLLGDVDSDWDVDSDDSIYLLYHIFFGEIDYPVYQPLDYNGDGVENSDDAVYLLYHVMFGANDYPLTRN